MRECVSAGSCVLSLESRALGPSRQGGAVLRNRSDAQSLSRSIDIVEINEITDDFEKFDDLNALEKPLKELYTDQRLESRL